MQDFLEGCVRVTGSTERWSFGPFPFLFASTWNINTMAELRSSLQGQLKDGSWKTKKI